jgi:hypothetical protein
MANLYAAVASGGASESFAKIGPVETEKIPRTKTRKANCRNYFTPFIKEM